MTDLLLHFLLFIVAGIVLVLAPLLIGMLVRPWLPSTEKQAVYECGEPAIGSSYIQFDIRFYVVALLFIIFDVEVAFFFPWATVYGGATQLADSRLSDEARMNLSDKLLNLAPGTSTMETAISAESARYMAWTGVADILVFFAFILVGFAYVWKRGDLDWVRSLMSEARESRSLANPTTMADQPAKTEMAS